MRLGQPRVELDLVDGRDHAGLVDDPAQVGLVEVGDADGACPAFLAQANERAALFSDGTGIAPTAGINIVAQETDGSFSVTNASSYETAQCLRSLSAQIRSSTDKLNFSGKTGKRPVIVLHGASDALIPIAHTSRRYATLAAPRNPNFRFLEIASGQHFDAFLAIPGMEPGFAPMQPFLDRSLDDVHAFLTQGKALPASGILR